MHIVGIIIGLIVLYNLWDYLFYVVGGVIGLVALIFLWCAKEERSKPNGEPLVYLILGVMCCGLSYCMFSYQVNSWHNTELIAQKQAQEQAQKEKEAAEKAQAEAERKAREESEKIQKNIERANQLSGYEQEIFYSKFQEGINSGLDENSAREKALAEVDAMLAAQAEAERKAREEEQARLAAEQKAREEEQRRAAEAEKARREEEQRVAAWGDKAQVKRYLEEIQPFALVDYVKGQSGITGPLANGEVKALVNHAFAMAWLAESQQNKPSEVCRQVAIYFACESELARHYASVKKDKDDVLDIVGGVSSGAKLPEIYSKQNAAEKKIREIADWCGADLSNFIETEIFRQIRKRLN